MTGVFDIITIKGENMDNLIFAIIQIANSALLLGWVILVIFTLKKLKDLEIAKSQKWLWAAIILAVPLLGLILFFATHSETKRS